MKPEQRNGAQADLQFFKPTCIIRTLARWTPMQMGANAVIGRRCETQVYLQGVLEVLRHGTAVLVEPQSPAAAIILFVDLIYCLVWQEVRDLKRFPPVAATTRSR
ncbi:MAG TPA: heavy metal-binding domain-containing protein, partial [Stellaceae bacterium]|nr:heavy metal-binding domain-containing protein [Stellaceae bacterium]